MIKNNKLYKIALLSLLTIAQSALASPTLERIRKTNTIRLGYSETVIPISWYDQTTKSPKGFGFEISQHIVEGLKESLKLPDLKIQYVPVPSKERWNMHANGDIDLHCSVTTNTLERQEQLVEFSYGYFVAHARMLVKKGSGIHNYSDLAGKNVALINGSFSGKFLQSKKNNFKIKELKIINNGLKEGFELLKTGEVAGLVYDDISLISFLLRHPDDQPNFEVVGKPITTENYGCTMQHGDKVFKQMVNHELAKMIHSQSVHKLYQKWFLQPIPDVGLTVGIPMSDATEKLLIMPNDKAVGQLQVE
ncbi:MAG: amino acid ABC transporter substrate-binding protein [Cardiobacteriaceae bacterium]|nr:amino acid ABC transporter substrate-binding protein [Cardiobacteriaceae bacterium]